MVVPVCTDTLYISTKWSRRAMSSAELEDDARSLHILTTKTRVHFSTHTVALTLRLQYERLQPVVVYTWRSGKRETTFSSEEINPCVQTLFTLALNGQDVQCNIRWFNQHK